jgi:alkaline phosphatase D
MEHEPFGLLPRTSFGLSRRMFLRGSALTALTLAAGLMPKRAAGVPAATIPFSLGVASGDPTHSSVVLWTRLAVDPLNGGGMMPIPLEVEWTVATDPQMQHVIRRGQTMAFPEDAHSVHVTVNGLAPDRWYWYQFQTDSELSPVGRTRTFPAPDSEPRLLRFAFASCQHWEEGFFTAWQHLAEEDIDFVIHLGDYIYEDSLSAGAVRQHVPASEIMSLEDYRNRHAQYRGDANLQAAHAQFPFIVTWDDHEVEDNYAGDMSENSRDADVANDVPAANFRARRTRAYKAYVEHMPIDRQRSAGGASLNLFRSFAWGRLAEFHVLDTRQFRSNQPCGGAKDLLAPAGDDIVIACGDELNSGATMTGAAQEAWLLESLENSRARWNVIAQQVMMASFDFGPGAAKFDPKLKGLQIRNVDAWDGYVAARNRLLDFVREKQLSNLVVLSGDMHSNCVADLKTDFNNPSSPVVGTEFVGPSITSGFPASFVPIVQAALLDGANAHIKFFEGAVHGYVRCQITPEQWRSDFRTVDTVLLSNSSVRTFKSFIVTDGRPGSLLV